uniref:Uncharacterized protein n=1 Tax=Acrobeloides nanus TaxID=290746 RepID=A0A914C820_9BILA
MEEDDDFYDDNIAFCFIEEPRQEESIHRRASCERKILSKKKQFEELENKTKELDTMIAELYQVLIIRKEMDRCASERRKMLEITSKTKFIYPDSLIINLNIHNHTEFHFHDWNIVVYLCPLALNCEIDEPGPSACISKVVKIVSLAPGQGMEASLLISTPTKLPILLEPQLVKVFRLEQPCTYKIGMAPILLTLWDLLTEKPLVFPLKDEEVKKGAKKVKKPNGLMKNETIINLPYRLIYLCAGAKATTESVLSFLLPISATYASPESLSVKGFVPFEETTSEIRLKITNHSTFAEIFVQASNGDCFHQLLTSLKARILVATSQIYRQPKESLQKQISYNNIEELWNSILEKLS